MKTPEDIMKAAIETCPQAAALLMLMDKLEESLGIHQSKQGKFRDYEPEQEYGTAHDIQEHIRYGGTREDY